MQHPTEERKNYNFLYELGKKNLRTGFKTACQSVEAIQGLDIANIESSQLLSGTWIKFNNTREDHRLAELRQAKWVLRFPKGDQAINEAWKKLTPLITENKLWDIKASAKSADHDTQVICVYVADFLNIEEIVNVYARLKECGALQLHFDQESLNKGSINYITDANTAATPLGKNKQTMPSITDSEIKELYDLRQQKGSLDASVYQERWNALAGILRVKIMGNEPLNRETTTYFSSDERDHRLQLVTKIDRLQTELGLSKFDQLNEQCRMLRQFLTGNYRLKTVELLKSVKELLNAKQPKGGFFSTIFSKDPLSQAYGKVIQFLDEQIKIEQKREHIAHKGPQESLDKKLQRKVLPDNEEAATNKVITGNKFKDKGIELTKPSSSAAQLDVKQSKSTTYVDEPPDKKTSEKEFPKWTKEVFKKQNYVATLKGSYNEEHFKSAINQLIENKLITSYQATSNGFEVVLPSNNKIAVDIKENKIYCKELTADGYNSAANLTLACGYTGWDMKNLVAAAQSNQKEAAENLYNAYAAGRALGENFTFSNLPDKVQAELEAKYTETTRLQPGI